VLRGTWYYEHSDDILQPYSEALADRLSAAASRTPPSHYCNTLLQRATATRYCNTRLQYTAAIHY